MAKVKLSQKYIDNTPRPPPNKSREEHCDLSIPGLYFETRATCTEWGTFFLRYKDEAGKTCHQKIGRSCDISLKQARDEARRLRAEIRSASRAPMKPSISRWPRARATR